MDEKDLEDLKDLKEVSVLNLKVNSLILSALAGMEAFPLSKTNVLDLLEDVKKVLQRMEKSKKDESKTTD